jgi:uncharacterized membrane protein YjgN (DUF898 family)
MVVVHWKSVLTGLVGGALLAFMVSLWIQGLQYRAAMAGDGAARFAKWPVLCGLIVGFAAGFWWENRKAR